MIKNAQEARALAVDRRWTVEKVLAAIEEVASKGEFTVTLEGRLPTDIYNEIVSRGFIASSDSLNDTGIRW